MTTRAQGNLAKDTDIIKTLVKNNEGNAGIELGAREPGVVRNGDQVSLVN